MGRLVWLGYFFSKKRIDSSDYFVGGQKIPAWVAAFSLYATGLSSISYVATTSNVYQSGWIFGVGGIRNSSLNSFSSRIFCSLYTENELCHCL